MIAQQNLCLLISQKILGVFIAILLFLSFLGTLSPPDNDVTISENNPPPNSDSGPTSDDTDNTQIPDEDNPVYNNDSDELDRFISIYQENVTPSENIELIDTNWTLGFNATGYNFLVDLTGGTPSVAIRFQKLGDVLYVKVSARAIFPEYSIMYVGEGGEFDGWNNYTIVLPSDLCDTGFDQTGHTPLLYVNNTLIDFYISGTFRIPYYNGGVADFRDLEIRHLEGDDLYINNIWLINDLYYPTS